MRILAMLVGLGVFIALNVFIANCFYDIARYKGFDEKRYFWMPFLFGVVGYILVAALPDRKKEQTAPEKPVKPLVPVQETEKAIGKWACPDCGSVLPGDVIQCKCGYRK